MRRPFNRLILTVLDWNYRSESYCCHCIRNLLFYTTFFYFYLYGGVPRTANTKDNYIEDKIYEVVNQGLDDVCAKELGEVVDILKDIEIMSYYSTVVEAMEEGKSDPHADMPDYLSRMYYSSTTNNDKATLETIMEDITNVMEKTPKEQKAKAKQDLLTFVSKITI